MPTRSGSIRLFRIFGIEVFLHWSWFLLAAYGVEVWRSAFDSPVAAIILYLLIFVIVTMHEFGHALACRSVGGQADQIFLWPLGGIAFVNPPQRPGAMLWSLAAGPLVNVVLIPVFLLAELLVRQNHWMNYNPDGALIVRNLAQINILLLIFNLLPVYPLDGGQILRSLLWFFLGPICSLFIAAGIGFIAAAFTLILALLARSWWYVLMALFILSRAGEGWKYARYLRAEADMTSAPPAPPGQTEKPVL